MSGTAILQAILEILYGGLQTGATALGTGISAFVKNMFFVVTAESGAIEGLSPFGIIVCVFAGIALVVGIGRLIYNLLAKFGSR